MGACCRLQLMTYQSRNRFDCSVKSAVLTQDGAGH
jgi:hypothetical protein